MLSISFEKTSDYLLAALWEIGTSGIVEEANGWRAYFPDAVDERDAAALAFRFAGRIEHIDAVAQSAQADVPWEAFAVGERWYVVPPGFAGSIPENRSRLETAASTAFGTGRHETTQLCLEALERELHSDDAVLDVGCGSGILGTAAELLGARHVFSCDTDEQATGTAARQHPGMVFLGSSEAVAETAIDLLIANIGPRMLDALGREFQRVLKPQGRLVLAGFGPSGVPSAYSAIEEHRKGEWLCWICKRAGIQPMPAEAGDSALLAAEWWL